MMTKIPTRGCNFLFRRYLSTTTNANDFGKKISSLFKQAEYDKLVDEIDRSPYGGDSRFMKLKVEALRASIAEKDDEARRTLNMIRYMEKNNYEPFPISINSQNKVIESKK